MHAEIIAEKCIGCGVCPGICPDVFEMEDALAMVKTEPVPESMHEETNEAAASCPTHAIVVTG
jgi:ferredoxin